MRSYRVPGLSNGSITGNDSGFRWAGKYRVEAGKVFAQVSVKQFASELEGLLGSNYDLELEGPSATPLLLTGRRTGVQRGEVIVRLNKLSR
jgi:hypothetical protein